MTIDAVSGSQIGYSNGDGGTMITVPVLPSWLAPSPPDGTVGIAYSYDTSNEVSGVYAPLIAILSGVLPDGLSMGSDGLIVGTPTTAENESFELSATNGAGTANSSSLSITVNAGGGGGTVTAALTASRITGPAPLAVNFDAIATTHTNGSIDTFRELAYTFNFGDTGSSGTGNWPYSSAPRNTEIGGPLAAHVYEEAGTYTVTVTALDSEGNFDTEQILITVTDPDVEFSGTNTVCISGNSDWTGAPAGASLVTSLPTIEANKRYLFRAGESFTQNISINYLSNIQVSSFGAGAQPQITGDVSIQSANPGTPTNPAGWASEIVISDLNINGAINNSVGGENILIHKNTTNERIGVGTTTQYYFDQAGSNDPGFTWCKNVFVVENVSDCGNLSSTGRYNLFTYANRLAVLGNSFTNPFEHNIRALLNYRSFMGHNELSNPGTSKHQFKLHSRGLDTFDEQLVNAPNPASRYIVVARNSVGDSDDANNWAVAVAPQNDGSAEGIEDAIVEANHFNSPNHINEIAFGGRRLTSRSNNTGANTVTTTTGSQAGSLPAEWRGPYYINHVLPE
jgi:hypothetical protein